MLIAAVVLAAGAAKRFGSDKRLHPVNGQPLLARTLAVYRAVLDDVAVVARPGEAAIAALTRAAGCRFVEAPEARHGQSRSLAAGVAAMRAADGLVIGLGDMPFVASATVGALVAAMARQPQFIVQPTHRGRAGNPVAFPAIHFDALTRLTGDAGAKGLIAAAADVLRLPTDDANILRDVDTPADIHTCGGVRHICSGANHARSPPREAQVLATRGSGPTNAPDTHPAVPQKGARGEAPKKTSPTRPAADENVAHPTRGRAGTNADQAC